MMAEFEVEPHALADRDRQPAGGTRTRGHRPSRLTCSTAGFSAATRVPAGFDVELGEGGHRIDGGRGPHHARRRRACLHGRLGSVRPNAPPRSRPHGTEPALSRRVGSTLLASTDARALLREPGVSRAASAVAVAEFLLRRPGPPAETLVAALRRVPAGHALTLDPGGERLTREWAPPHAGSLAGRGRGAVWRGARGRRGSGARRAGGRLSLGRHRLDGGGRSDRDRERGPRTADADRRMRRHRGIERSRDPADGGAGARDGTSRAHIQPGRGRARAGARTLASIALAGQLPVDHGVRASCSPTRARRDALFCSTGWAATSCSTSASSRPAGISPPWALPCVKGSRPGGATSTAGGACPTSCE